jgi:hypothetical protein
MQEAKDDVSEPESAVDADLVAEGDYQPVRLVRARETQISNDGIGE